MSLINREDLLEQFESGALLFQDKVREIIQQMPEAIVRCENCKHYRNYVYCDLTFCDMQPEDYCSYAERGTDA